MRCHICDRLIDEPKYNPELAEYEPCDTCMDIIESTVGSWTEKPAADEDFGGVDPLWEDLYPTAYDPSPDK